MDEPDYIETAGRHHASWHKFKGGLYFAFSCIVGIFTYLITEVTAVGLACIPAVLFTLWSLGDMFLNWRMGWKTFERGDKSGMDIVPFWARFALLVATIITILIIV